MATFVLVHGAWHGGWCCESVAPLLRATAHRVETPDLPGHGDDRTPPVEISNRLYTEAVRRVIAGLAEPVLLVGHDEAGSVLVYLAAFLLRNGEAVLDGGPTDRASLLAANLVSYPTPPSAS